MKKHSLFLLAALCWCALTNNASGQITFSGGDGSSGNPYQITTVAQLSALSVQISQGTGVYNAKCYKLMNNLDLSGVSVNYSGDWLPIGTYDSSAPVTESAYAFKGVFDGNNKVISNLYVNTGLTIEYGLFGYVQGGTVKNLGVTYANINTSNTTAQIYIGAVVGRVQNGTVSGCYSSGTVKSTAGSTHHGGGVVGYSNNSTITDCYSQCSVTVTSLGLPRGGGVIGTINGGTVSGCYFTGTVTAGSSLANSFAGGIAGLVSGTAFSSCYSTGAVTCTGGTTTFALAGGIVGCIANGSVTKCYSTGAITASGSTKNAYAGGIIGFAENPGTCNVSYCYSLGAITASTTMAGASFTFSGGIIGYSAGSGTISNCYATGAVKAISQFTSSGHVVYVGGIVGGVDGKIQNCAALNPSIYAQGSDGAIARVSVLDDNGSLSGNVGFINMLNSFDIADWDDKGLSKTDGLDITAADINTDGTIGGRFTTTNGWTVQNGKLPGFGAAVNMPAHLQYTVTAPTVITSSLPGGTVGTAYSQTLAATGTTPITWSVSSGSLPGGLSISTSGVISGTPAAAGTFNFTVRATNSAGNNTKSLSIVIATNAVAPAVTTSSLPDGNLGTTYSQTLAATGTTPITWSITNGSLPGGLTLATNGVISGTPTAGGTFSFTVKATNSAGSDTKALSIIINTTGVPSITTTSLPSGNLGTAYSQTLAADGVTPITWSITNGSLPGGLTLATNGVISGTPTAGGTFSFTVKATNSLGNDSKALSITINTAGAPSITTTSLPGGNIGTAYIQTLAAGGNTPLTWTLTSGALPGGLILATNGKLSGIPTAAGIFTFTVKATNSIGFDAKEFSITIGATGIAETKASNVTVYPNPTKGELRISLPNPSKGGAYEAEIFDVTGHKVGAFSVSPSFEGGRGEADISYLPAGIYYLKIGTGTVKVIKE